MLLSCEKAKVPVATCETKAMCFITPRSGFIRFDTIRASSSCGWKTENMWILMEGTVNRSHLHRFPSCRRNIHLVISGYTITKTLFTPK